MQARKWELHSDSESITDRVWMPASKQDRSSCGRATTICSVPAGSADDNNAQDSKRHHINILQTVELLITTVIRTKAFVHRHLAGHPGYRRPGPRPIEKGYLRHRDSVRI